MNDSDAIGADSRPSLQSFARLQYDEARQRWVLQAPERVFVLDESGKEIVALCDGETSVAGIVDRLVADFDAPRDVIEHDVHAVIRLLAEKNLMTVETGPAPE